MKNIILIILLSFTFAYAQFPTFSRFPSYLNTASWIPTDGLVLLHNPGAQMIAGSPGNRYYPNLTYGSNLVTNGDFHDFTMDNADVEDSVKGHWIFSSYYDSQEGGSGYIGQNWSGGTPSLGADLVTNGSFTVDETGWVIVGGVGTYDIVTGNGFSGNALRLNCTTQPYRAYQDISQLTTKIYKYTFKYRCSGDIYFYWENSSGTQQILSANTGNAISYTYYGENPASGYIAFYLKDNGEWLEIDDIVVQAIDCDNALYFNGWTDYDDVESDLSGTVHPSYENGDTLGFDGATTYWSIADDADFEPKTADDFTLETWINTSGTSDAIMVKHDSTTATNVGWSWYIDSAGKQLFLIGDGTAHTRCVSTNTVNTGAWVHIAVVADRSGNATFYKNGVADGTTDITAQDDAAIENALSMYIGRNNAANGYFNGSIAEARFTKSALSAQSIAESYGLGKGWTTSDTNPTTLKNESFGQRFKPTGANYIQQEITVTTTDVYEMTASVTGNGASETFVFLEDGVFISQWATAVNGVSTSYKYFHQFAITSPALRMYTNTAEDVTFDNIVLRKVTNVSAPDSIVTDYSGEGNTGYPISDMEDEQPTHPYGWIYDGVADYLNFGDVLNVGTNDFILWCWFRDNGNTSEVMVLKYDGTSKGYWIRNSGDVLQGYVRNGANSNVTGNTDITDNIWHLAHFVKTSTDLKVYLDGVDDTNVLTGTPNLNYDNTADLLIGAYPGPLVLWSDYIGLSGIYIFDGLEGRPSSLPTNYETAIIETIYNNTSIYYSDD